MPAHRRSSPHSHRAGVYDCCGCDASCADLVCCDDPACLVPMADDCCGNALKGHGASANQRRGMLKRAMEKKSHASSLARKTVVAAVALCACLLCANGVSADDLRPGFMTLNATDGQYEFDEEEWQAYCSSASTDEYDLGLHIAAVFIQVSWEGGVRRDAMGNACITGYFERLVLDSLRPGTCVTSVNHDVPGIGFQWFKHDY